MKLYFFMTIFIICACIHKTEKKVNIDELPWYISLPDSPMAEFDIQDSLTRFSQYLKSIKTRTPNLNCYMADLEYLNGNIDKARQLIDLLLNTNIDVTVDNYLIPIYNYLVLDKPHRLNSIPPILQEDFEYFVTLCQNYFSDKVIVHKPQLLLLKKINILDQWFRTPNREYTEDSQSKYDLICQSILDSGFYAIDLSDIDNSRDIVYSVILHSKDCEWTERWITKYADDFKDDKFIISHLSHFLYRSDCRNIARIKRSVEAHINQLKAMKE